MLNATRCKKLLVTMVVLASSIFVALTVHYVRQVVLLARLSPAEKKIIGAWSWTYLEGVGRMIFTADHRVKEGFPPDDPNKPAVRDRDFTYTLSGTWRVEGDVLVTDIDNQLLIDLAGRRGFLNWLFSDPPSYMPAFDRKVRHERIISIDDQKMIFEAGSPLQRVHR